MWRAIGLNLSLFGMLFLLHIVAARFDANTAFTVVAFLITLHVLFFGPACLVVSRLSSQEHRRILNRWGALASLPLALGLGWAYGGMAWSWPEWPLILTAWLAVHVMMDRRLALSA
ncbi:MAG: hypothetical protein DWC10_04420 [Candidatus Poseidoniales archaeon]|nr:MAG: hypothetical protein DWC10_04420 [Candidatus Poseidoniales archaeon]